MGINNSLLKSIQTIVNKAINIAPFDKTRQAQVITNNEDGTYTIRLDGILYNNIPSYPIFNGIEIGTIVKVVIPSNQSSQMYIQPSKGGGGGDHKELTQAEYDALSPSEKNNGTVYFITDSAPNTVVINDSVPIGAIQAYGAQVAPYGWHICDGSAVRRDAYPELFAVIGTTYGSGDGSTTFNLPDLKGRVITGVGLADEIDYNLGAKVDAGVPNIVGSFTARATDYNESQIIFYDSSDLFTVSQGGRSADTVHQVSGTKTVKKYTFDASKANSHYGASSTVQPNTTVCNYIIKVKEPAIVTASTAPSVHDFIDMFYPVGSYYESSDASFDPNADWGGTWELEESGQVHVSAGSEYTIGSSGGSKTHDHLYALQYGGYYSAVCIEGSTDAGVFDYKTNSIAPQDTIGSMTTNINGAVTASTKSQSMNFYRSEGHTSNEANMQPYIVVNRWHRIA